MQETAQKMDKAILVGADFCSLNEIENNLEELKGLCDTASIEVVGYLTQILKEYNVATFIGSGKVEELADLVKKTGANLVIFDTSLEGAHIRNLEQAIDAKVMDRSMIILDIFARRAKSNEGKIQVELAQLKYNLPRISALSGSAGRFGSGGVGMRGPGETKIELDKRVIKNQISKLSEKIEKLSEQRQLNRNKRYMSNKKIVAIVGYTNAGKSTLLNTITKAGVYADDKLFATLDTTTRNIYTSQGREFLLTDTVGFINKLPHEFIEAFKSTLEEVCVSDLILHVVDISNPDFIKQIKTVNEVLEKIGALNIKQLMVYNKIDKSENILAMQKDAIYISAKKNIGIDRLKDEIIKILYGEQND